MHCRQDSLAWPGCISMNTYMITTQSKMYDKMRRLEGKCDVFKTIARDGAHAMQGEGEEENAYEGGRGSRNEGYLMSTRQSLGG